MKIKERNLGIWFVIIFSIGACSWSIGNSIINIPNFLSNISFNTVSFYGILVLTICFLLASTLYGSYIEVTDKEIVQVEGYTKKRYSTEKISKIYYAGHLFLGPTLFMAYAKDKNKIVERKLFVLSHYRKSDIRVLLRFLHSKYPLIQLDEFCQKVIEGEDPERK